MNVHRVDSRRKLSFPFYGIPSMQPIRGRETRLTDIKRDAPHVPVTARKRRWRGKMFLLRASGFFPSLARHFDDDGFQAEGNLW